MNVKDFLSKLDVIAVLGFLIAVETQISNGSMSFAHSLPEAWIPAVKEWAANLASLGGLLVGVLRMSANGASVTSTVVKILIAAFLLSTFVGATPAMAQVKLRPPAVTGNIAKDIQTDLAPASTAPTAIVTPGQGGLLTPDALIKKIIALAAPDLAYAAAMASSANTNSSNVRLACIKAIQALNTQASGANLKNADGSVMAPPAEPHIFTDLETIAEGIDSLSPTGPLYTSCAGAAALANTNVLTFINSVVTGTAATTLLIPK